MNLCRIPLSCSDCSCAARLDEVLLEFKSQLECAQPKRKPPSKRSADTSQGLTRERFSSLPSSRWQMALPDWNVKRHVHNPPSLMSPLPIVPAISIKSPQGFEDAGFGRRLRSFVIPREKETVSCSLVPSRISCTVGATDARAYH